MGVMELISLAWNPSFLLQLGVAMVVKALKRNESQLNVEIHFVEDYLFPYLLSINCFPTFSHIPLPHLPKNILILFSPSRFQQARMRLLYFFLLFLRLASCMSTCTFSSLRPTFWYREHRGDSYGVQQIQLGPEHLVLQHTFFTDLTAWWKAKLARLHCTS